MDYESFVSNQKTVDTTINNLENIGEAAKIIEDEDDDFEWRNISDLRDVLVHQYFRADKDIIWDIIQNEIPELEKKVNKEMSTIKLEYSQNPPQHSPSISHLKLSEYHPVTFSLHRRDFLLIFLLLTSTLQ